MKSPVIQSEDFYPFGLAFNNYQRENSLPDQFQYNGKEIQNELDINWLDYGARMYMPEIGRWGIVDNRSELYFATTPFAYALNQPTQAVDPDGRLVIFINGMHDGSGGKPEYWRSYTKVITGYEALPGVGNLGVYDILLKRPIFQTHEEAFDSKVMSHVGDNRFLYRDGSSGGISGLPGNLVANNRKDAGYEQGSTDAAMIINNLAKDKNHNIIESIKVVTHSMGAAYAKGYIQAIVDYTKANKISGVVIEFEADFAPFQPGSQEAIEADVMGPTLQFSHVNDFVAYRSARTKTIEGAEQQDTSNDKRQNHSIQSFVNQISKLPAGTYKVKRGGKKIVPIQ